MGQLDCKVFLLIGWVSKTSIFPLQLTFGIFGDVWPGGGRFRGVGGLGGRGMPPGMGPLDGLRAGEDGSRGLGRVVWQGCEAGDEGVGGRSRGAGVRLWWTGPAFIRGMLGPGLGAVLPGSGGLGGGGGGGEGRAGLLLQFLAEVVRCGSTGSSGWLGFCWVIRPGSGLQVLRDLRDSSLLSVFVGRSLFSAGLNDGVDGLSVVVLVGSGDRLGVRPAPGSPGAWGARLDFFGWSGSVWGTSGWLDPSPGFFRFPPRGEVHGLPGLGCSVRVLRLRWSVRGKRICHLVPSVRPLRLGSEAAAGVVFEVVGHGQLL